MNVLFICKANVGRSQMASAFFNKLSKKNKSTSAGTQVGEKEGQIIGENEKTKLLIKVMGDEGIDIKNFKRKQLTPQMVDKADKIIVMAEKSECSEYLLKSNKVIFWKIEDVNGRYDSFEYHVKTRDDIKNLVDNLIKEIG
jgi:arsenate reductase (thioredoxin)